MTHAAKQASFTDLSAGHVAVFFLGAVQQSRGALNRSMSGPLGEDYMGLADRFLERVEDQLYVLAKDDPSKARDVCERLKALCDDVAKVMAIRLRREINRNHLVQLDRV